MPFDPPTIKRTVLAVVVAIVLTLVVNASFGLAYYRWWGAAAPEIVRQARIAAPYVILGLFLAAAGTILGGLLTADRAGRNRRLIGLAAGAGLAVLAILVSVLQGGLDPWLPPNAVMAVFGGWLAGSMGAREAL